MAAGATPSNLDSLRSHQTLNFSGVAGVNIRLAHRFLEQRVVRPDCTARGSAHDAAILADNLVRVQSQYPAQLPPLVVEQVSSLSAGLAVRPQRQSALNYPVQGALPTAIRAPPRAIPTNEASMSLVSTVIRLLSGGRPQPGTEEFLRMDAAPVGNSPRIVNAGGSLRIPDRQCAETMLRRRCGCVPVDLGLKEVHYVVGVGIDQPTTAGVDEDRPDDGEELNHADITAGNSDPN